MNKYLTRALKFFRQNKLFVLTVLLLFGTYVFFRTFQLEERAQFTWDQVDNAWQAKNLIVDGVYPLTGMRAKQDSGVSIGPFYYYFVAGFYYLTDLDPIASPIVATVTSAIAFIVLLYCSWKLFNKWVGLIAVTIVSFSYYLINFDRVQWPVGFIPSLGIAIFLSLFMINKKKYLYIPILLTLLGFSLHIHFTSIFYFILVFLFLPFIPRTKTAIKYFALSVPLFLVWIIPFLITSFQSSSNMGIVSFFVENNVGLHLRRIIQVAEIAFSENAFILGNFLPAIFGIVVLPIFLLTYFKNIKKNIPLVYLLVTWTVVPWGFLSMFRGELTPYYFSMNRFISIAILAYIIYSFIRIRPKFTIPLASFIFVFFLFNNVMQFVNYKGEGLLQIKKTTNAKFEKSMGNEFTYGSGESYLYYFYERKYYGDDYHNKQ